MIYSYHPRITKSLYVDSNASRIVLLSLLLRSCSSCLNFPLPFFVPPFFPIVRFLGNCTSSGLSVNKMMCRRAFLLLLVCLGFKRHVHAISEIPDITEEQKNVTEPGYAEGCYVCGDYR